jgi:hypothetical protein
MVAINSIPQQEVAKGSGHIEFFLASPTTSLNLVEKKPSPLIPSGGFTKDTASSMLAFFALMLKRTGRIVYN